METSFPILASHKNCTGCMTCGDACPRGCISFVLDKDGFWYPEIDRESCIKCHSCQKSCPIITTKAISYSSVPTSYAAWADKSIRKKSASGGAFYSFASQVLEEGGYVAGAVFDGYKVKHILTSNKDELEKIQGTKYFQSDTSGVYRRIKKLLHEGNKVLFSGTSCQVAGLLNVIGNERDNLITIDLVCFGVPSSLTIGVEERMRGKKLKRIVSNRDKKHEGGWRNSYYMTCEWNDGTTTISSPRQSFMLGSFCSGKVMRNSCYRCPFKTISRQSDLTIGDYHCLPGFDEQKTDGISLLYIHTEKGAQLLKRTSSLTVFERDIYESLSQKRTIYYNDTMFGRRLTRLWMPFILTHAPNWLLNLLYKDIVRSKNPLVLPFTAIDAFFILTNNYRAKKKLNHIKI